MLGLIILISVISAPTDPASKLLEEYLSIPSDTPNHGTEAAAKFWMREAHFLDLQAMEWTLDSTGKCKNFITYLPATSENPGRPILLLHHGDTKAANESAWAHPPFKPEWVEAKNDWELYGRGAIEGKGAGVTHWMAFKTLREKQRSRDIFFVMTCGSENSDSRGAEAFVNFFIKPIPNVTYDLSTADKLELAVVLSTFLHLQNIEFVWNGGSFGEKTPIAPYILAPIATSQKGRWLGEIIVSPANEADASTNSPGEFLKQGAEAFNKKNQNFIESIRSLHTEMKDLVVSVSTALPIWERIINLFHPRYFFESRGLHSLVTSWWYPKKIRSEPLATNSIAVRASMELEYRFLGEKEDSEIKRDINKIFERQNFSKKMKLAIETKNYNPFRRDFFQGSESEIFKQVIGSYPQTIVTPYITPRLTDSRYFRMAGIRAFDFTPFFLTDAEIESTQGANEHLPHLELLRAIEIETMILEKLLR
ncbi:MAG: dapE [Bacteriovoracaceae bacterium]|nr:dapE [Bacteriovoracaceae bacterium]